MREPDDSTGEAVALEITGELDLHTFHPSEVAELCADYIDECARRGIAELRIVHGKGRGVLRRVVHGVLARHPRVVSYRLAGDGRGQWGATLVQVKTID